MRTVLNTSGTLLECPSNSTSGRFHSSINKGRSFQGEFFDEFALPLFDQTISEKKVLVLGAGLGSCIEPIRHFFPITHIELVDTDKTSLDFINQKFPSALNSKIHQCAMQYIQNTTKKFDLIYIDLFDQNGFWNLTFNESFFLKLKQLLKPHGKIAYNIYGICPFLGFDKSEHPIGNLARLIGKEQKLCYYPYRRNILAVIAHSNTENSLSPIDLHRIKYDFNYYLQIKALNPLILSSAKSCTDLSFAHLQIIEKNLWSEFGKLHGITSKQLKTWCNVSNWTAIEEIFLRIAKNDLRAASGVLTFLIFELKNNSHLENSLNQLFEKLSQHPIAQAGDSIHWFWTHYWACKLSGGPND